MTGVRVLLRHHSRGTLLSVLTSLSLSCLIWSHMEGRSCSDLPGQEAITHVRLLGASAAALPPYRRRGQDL